MGTLLFHPHSLLSFYTSFAFTNHPKLGTSIFFSKEFADGSLKYLPRLKVLCMIPDGIRRGRPRKIIFPIKTQETNGSDISDLVRNIEASISKKSPSNTNERESDSSEEQSSDGFWEDFIQNRKQEKTQVKNGDVRLTKLMRKRRQRMLNGKSKLSLSSLQPLKRQLPAHLLTQPPKNQSAAAILKSTQQLRIQNLVALKSIRPRSNFVKRSPIPPQSTQRGMIAENLNNEASPAVTIESEKPKLPIVDKMKVAELREMAKSRGIEGYYKLKKKELLAMLKSEE